MILVGDILLKWGKLENDIRLMFKKMKMFKEKKKYSTLLFAELSVSFNLHSHDIYTSYF